ncbi:hypothetical protein P171DRAFT_414739 [Karstenula rhodostoma CBS 690.94]|uniref:Alpha/beta-hydrolase n=1 Tax=Karstenula rhodostoma CBS 690.94 TaxID=1392251 RepID=A0A9P4PE11_9PLEO|nr:hypothetical protein P171DRAFT_414739 [Karstenula rhodostoma CBS 690.94]
MLLSLLILALPGQSASERPHKPITLSSTGGFTIGGRTIPAPSNPNLTLSCDHGYMEYFLPLRPRKTSLVMWHSSSTQVWQNTWSGGPGFKDLFLQRDYPVYLWDGPHVGRANWPCSPTLNLPTSTDATNFLAWNFGPSYKEWWPDVRFPTHDAAAWHQATSARYIEYETKANVDLHARAAATAADSGSAGTNIVYLTNSAAGLRAQLAATLSATTNIKAIVAYESIGFVYPDSANVTAGVGGFGPYVVSGAQFRKLAAVPAVLFVWGDHRGEGFGSLAESRRVAGLINEVGGNARVVKLGEVGVRGATHVPFADLGNEDVAELLEGFLEGEGLDGYVDGEGEGE